MQTIEGLRRQIEVAEGLHAVVKTMKVLAAASIRQYEEAVRSLGEYNRTVESGLQILLRQQAGEAIAAATRVGPEERSGIVVFGSGQGLCGRFNEQIASFAAETLRARAVQAETVLVVGRHALTPLEAAGIPATNGHPVPGSIAGITPSVQKLVLELETWIRERHVGRILLFYNKPRSGTSFEPRMQQLFPFDEDWLVRLSRKPWPSCTLPTFTMPRDRLFAALVRQYVFVSLYRALAESLAAEHTSRLTSMQAAEKNIEERLDQLQAQYRQQRQHLVTEEVLDIMAAFEALTTDAT